MSLRVFGDRLVLNTKGITILLENGFRIEKPDVKNQGRPLAHAPPWLIDQAGRLMHGMK